MGMLDLKSAFDAMRLPRSFPQGAIVPLSSGGLYMNLSDIDLLARFPELSDEEKHERTLAGLADVDAGRTISHQEMLAWMRSLFDRPNSSK